LNFDVLEQKIKRQKYHHAGKFNRLISEPEPGDSLNLPSEFAPNFELLFNIMHKKKQILIGLDRLVFGQQAVVTT